VAGKGVVHGRAKLPPAPSLKGGRSETRLRAAKQQERPQARRLRYLYPKGRASFSFDKLRTVSLPNRRTRSLPVTS